LYEARQQIKCYLPHLHHGLDITPQQLHKTKEVIMASTKTIQQGTMILERLALHHQIKLCNHVQNQVKLDHFLLEEIGKIQNGSQFVADIEAFVDFPLLCRLISHCDPWTEARLMNELEKCNPEFAETLKQNLFVFEDLILLDHAAINTLRERVDESTWLLALKGVRTDVLNYVLSTLPNDYVRNTWIKNITVSPAQGWDDILQSQMVIMEELRLLNEEGKVVVDRRDSGVVIRIVS